MFLVVSVKVSAMLSMLFLFMYSDIYIYIGFFHFTAVFFSNFGPNCHKKNNRFSIF